MAGRPRRRARLDAAERAGVQQFPEPSKPITEMTTDERAAYAASVRRARRDYEVFQGKRRPRSTREAEIWRKGLIDDTEQGGQRDE